LPHLFSIGEYQFHREVPAWWKNLLPTLSEQKYRRLLQNTGAYVLNYTVKHPKKPSSEYIYFVSGIYQSIHFYLKHNISETGFCLR
jgi:hypothetical protein